MPCSLVVGMGRAGLGPHCPVLRRARKLPRSSRLFAARLTVHTGTGGTHVVLPGDSLLGFVTRVYRQFTGIDRMPAPATGPAR